MINLLYQALIENELHLTENQEKKLQAYLQLLQTWNRVYNLTAIVAPREMIYLHLIDSLIIYPFLQGNRCLDVGTGAGLPGIPLAILDPEKKWTLVDKNSKKTRFLTQVIAELQLPNVETCHYRSENFQVKDGFDSILARALGTISMFVETTAHLLAKDGCFLALKGKFPHEEIALLPSNVIVEKVTKLTIKGIDIERHLVCLRLKS